MSAEDFEMRLTKGRAQWLLSAVHYTAGESFVAELTHDPERSQAQRVIYFRGVSLIADDWTDRDDQSMETLLGAHEEMLGHKVNYRLVTDQREITINATERAQVLDV